MTQALQDRQGWLAHASECVLGTGTTVFLVGPTAGGVGALYTMGWHDWADAIGAKAASRAAGIFPAPWAAISQAGDRFETIEHLHAAITGDTRKPVVLERDLAGAECRLVAWVPPTLAWFKGHFPGQPVVPGVALVGWAVAEIGLLHRCARPIREFRQMKFQRIVEPGASLQFACSLAGGERASYLIRSRLGVHASGQILFGAER